MEIDDRIVNYEISKQLSEAGVKGVENVDEKQLSNRKKELKGASSQTRPTL